MEPQLESKHKEIASLITRWAATRSDEIVFDPKDGYYSFSIVADAYEKGAEELKVIKEGFRTKHFDNALLSIEAIDKLFEITQNEKIIPQKVFVNTSIEGVSILLSVPKDVYDNIEILESIYNKIALLQSEYINKEKIINIGLIPDVNNINLSLIEEDGYSFGIDLLSNKKIQFHGS